ncbi:YdcH family protein [Sagittula sp. S175]|uniref:YdcH family protein n=1 Tax=Sagittula sp. S175 TaxID=3415129 RepID=UPI003C7E9E07
MSHVPHQLAEDFPEFADKIRDLKGSDAHFAKLADAYSEVNEKVAKAETNVSPMEQLAEDQLRKERAALKDEIYALLRA